MTHLCMVTTALFLAMLIPRGSSLLTKYRSFDVYYEKKYVKFECVVSPLNSRLRFIYNETIVAVCSVPIPHFYAGKCYANFGEITQSISEEKTTFTLEYSAFTNIDGLWKCCHATGNKSCISTFVHVPFLSDSECKKATFWFFLLSFLPAILGYGLGYIFRIRNTSGNRYIYLVTWLSFYSIMIGCVFAVIGYFICLESIQWYLYLILPSFIFGTGILAAICFDISDSKGSANRVFSSQQDMPSDPNVPFISSRRRTIAKANN